jgi:AcrR family transcriptional regulator
MALGDTPRTRVTSAVIAAKILEGLSLDEIASQIGISRHSMRHYTPSVKRIVQAALYSEAQKLAEAVRTALVTSREAMDATDAEGNADWPARLNGVRALASLIQAAEKGSEADEASVNISASVSYSLIEALDAYRQNGLPSDPPGLPARDDSIPLRLGDGVRPAGDEPERHSGR